MARSGLRRKTLGGRDLPRSDLMGNRLARTGLARTGLARHGHTRRCVRATRHLALTLTGNRLAGCCLGRRRLPLGRRRCRTGPAAAARCGYRMRLRRSVVVGRIVRHRVVTAFVGLIMAVGRGGLGADSLDSDSDSDSDPDAGLRVR
ncbi:hypothetical protein Save01_09175 [Streptomyces avermitilis]